MPKQVGNQTFKGNITILMTPARSIVKENFKEKRFMIKPNHTYKKMILSCLLIIKLMNVSMKIKYMDTIKIWYWVENSTVKTCRIAGRN